MEKSECPCCKTNLEMKQINFDEAVLICTNLKCPYPLDGDVRIYKRRLKDVNPSIPSLCANTEIRNCNYSNSYKSKDILKNSSLHVEESPKISNETVIMPECTSSPHHMTNLRYHITETNNFENLGENSETIVNVMIEEATNTNCNAENTDYDVLEIEVEIDSVSQEIIVKKVHDHPNTKNEEVTSNETCIKEIGETNLAPNYIDNLIDAKIDEILKDADISSIASIETMSEDIDWLNELLEL